MPGNRPDLAGREQFRVFRDLSSDERREGRIPDLRFVRSAVQEYIKKARSLTGLEIRAASPTADELWLHLRRCSVFRPMPCSKDETWSLQPSAWSRRPAKH